MIFKRLSKVIGGEVLCTDILDYSFEALETQQVGVSSIYLMLLA